MKTSTETQGHLSAIATCAIREFRMIATSYSILLVMIGGIFVYGLLYNYMYAPNLIREAPVTVVDKSNTPLSRAYARLLDASPQVAVYSHAPDMPAAKTKMKTDRTVGIVFIPEDFESRVGRGEQSVFLAFGNTSAFLDFAALEEAGRGALPHACGILLQKCNADVGALGRGVENSGILLAVTIQILQKERREQLPLHRIFQLGALPQPFVQGILQCTVVTRKARGTQQLLYLHIFRHRKAARREQAHHAAGTQHQKPSSFQPPPLPSVENSQSRAEIQYNYSILAPPSQAPAANAQPGSAAFPRACRRRSS